MKMHHSSILLLQYYLHTYIFSTTKSLFTPRVLTHFCGPPFPLNNGTVTPTLQVNRTLPAFKRTFLQSNQPLITRAFFRNSDSPLSLHSISLTFSILRFSKVFSTFYLVKLWSAFSKTPALIPVLAVISALLSSLTQSKLSKNSFHFWHTSWLSVSSLPSSSFILNCFPLVSYLNQSWTLLLSP